MSPALTSDFSTFDKYADGTFVWLAICCGLTDGGTYELRGGQMMVTGRDGPVLYERL